MKRNGFALMLAGIMTVSLLGCKKEETSVPELPKQPEIENIETTPNAETAESEQEQTIEEFSFAAFKNLEFTFYSGAGGWGTLMWIKPNGSFSGVYSDSEMGLKGEGYQNGTVYQSDFSGTFTEPVKVDDFTWSTKIQKITYEKEPGTEEIRDDILYSYTTAFGLDGAEEILLYQPGMPISELPEEYRNWAGVSLFTEDQTELPFWGLYNTAMDGSFASHNIIERAQEQMKANEEYAASVEESLQEDSLSQAELNIRSEYLYQAWDYALNDVWRALTKVLGEEEMKELVIEEREWISMKEEAMEDAGAEAAGGSMQPMVMNLKGAELTKIRVYELVEILNEEIIAL